MEKLLRTLLLAGLALASGAAPASEQLWSLLRGGGQVVLVRHTQTDPGVGDPPEFRLDDCATQRNLNEQGRGDAVRLGVAIRDRKVPVAQVLASPWCRTIDTARLAFGRAPRTSAALANLHGRAWSEDAQVAELRKLVQAPPRGGNLFLVTHGSTIYALAGITVGMGEMVVLTPRAGSFQVAGRLAVP